MKQKLTLPAATYGITRIDSDKTSTHAWHVTISRQRKRFSKYFSDGIYGGKRKALAAAMRYREEVLANNPPFALRQFCEIVKRNNRCGISGISRIANTRKNGVLCWYWNARWSPEPYKSQSKKFSIARHGEEKAFKMAVRYRKKMLAQLQGEFNPSFSKNNKLYL